MPYARQTPDGIEVLSGGTITSQHSYAINGEPRTEQVQFAYGDLLLWSDAERAAHGIYPIVDDEVPAGKIATEPHLEAGDGVFHRRFTLADIPPPDGAALLAYAASARWSHEIGGVSVPGMGTIATDDRSKMLIFAARTKAKEDAATTKRWKVAPGQFVTLDAAALIAIGDAVEAHVTACFDKEADVSAAIEAGTITTFAAIDSAFSA